MTETEIPPAAITLAVNGRTYVVPQFGSVALAQPCATAECPRDAENRLHFLDGKPLGTSVPQYCTDCRLKQQQEARRAIDSESQRETLRRMGQLSERQAAAVYALDVPPLYAGVTLDHMRMHGPTDDRKKQAAALDFGRKFIDDWPEVPEVLLLTGTYGSGKGHWVWSVTAAIAAKHGARCRVLKLSDLIREIRGSWRVKDADSEQRVLERYRKLDLLVIDEVSRHAFYGEATQHLYDLVDYRIEQRRPTILTSNEREEEIRAILGPAVFNRLEGHGYLVDFGQASWRSRQGAA